LVAATVTIAEDSGEPGRMPSEPYVFGSTLTRPGEVWVYLFGHELAHVEDAATPQGRSERQHADMLSGIIMTYRATLPLTRFLASDEAKAADAVIRVLSRKWELTADTAARAIVESYRRK
jgi:hypothetical protein